jgi:hypothetical protein
MEGPVDAGERAARAVIGELVRDSPPGERA